MLDFPRNRKPKISLLQYRYRNSISPIVRANWDIDMNIFLHTSCWGYHNRPRALALPLLHSHHKSYVTIPVIRILYYGESTKLFYSFRRRCFAIFFCCQPQGYVHIIVTQDIKWEKLSRVVYLFYSRHS